MINTAAMQAKEIVLTPSGTIAYGDPDHAGAFGTGLITAVSNPAAQIDFANDPFPDRGAPR